MGANLKEHELQMYIAEYKFNRKGLIYGKPLPLTDSHTTVFQGTDLQEIDHTDLRIIQALSQNCRVKNAQLAQTIGVSEDTVRQRIAKTRATQRDLWLHRFHRYHQDGTRILASASAT